MIATKGTICPENVKYLSKSYDAYKELGFDIVPSTIAVGIKNWDKESLHILKTEYDKIVKKALNDDSDNFRWAKLNDSGDRRSDYYLFKFFCIGTCGANGAAITLTPRNELCACTQFSYLVQHGKSVKIGDIDNGIDKDGLEFLFKLRKSYAKKLYSDKNCNICVYKASCEQCPAMSLKYFGDMNADKELNCEAIKIEQLAAFKYMYLKEKKIWKKIQSENQ